LANPSNIFHVAAQYQPWMREIGLDAEAVFEHPDIKPWRTLADRENCTLDATLGDGRRVRLHVKRYTATKTAAGAMLNEVAGFRLLQAHGIPTAPLVASGMLTDGRSFVITEDLAGYGDAEKLIAAGTPFDRLLEPTARLTAKLHNAGLHHRDLYLCHFFARVPDSCEADIKLIDVARVKSLPRLFARRWIVKDLAQFWYSTLSLPITDRQRDAWLSAYAAARQIDDTASLRRAIVRKSNWIARHDRRLRQREPTRNISIPS
jgi:heptose I phosphotransferase